MFPPELAAIPHWINWQSSTKKPLDPSGRVADATRPENWQTFLQAAFTTPPECCSQLMKLNDTFTERHLFTPTTIHLTCRKCNTGNHLEPTRRVGFVLTGDYVVVDVDHEPWLTDLSTRYGSITYYEISPNGGLHIWFKGKSPNLKSRFEIYSSKRYVTMTGLGNDLPITQATDEEMRYLVALAKKPSLRSPGSI